MPEQKHIIKRLVYRLVKRHIAGSTMESVLETIRRLNGQGLHATTTLLNDHVGQQAKARYNTNAYVQFIKQTARLNLNSDVSLRLSQIGFGLDEAMMGRNLGEIMQTAEENRLKVWMESEDDLDNDEMLGLYRDHGNGSSSLGVELAPSYEENGSALKLIKSKDMVKLRCRLHKEPGKGSSKDDKKESSSALKLYKSYIDKLRSMKASVTVLDQNAHIIPKIAAMSKDYRDDITFEAPLGYGSKQLRKMAEKKFNISVYVPYGKDWVPYMINKLTEGRLRNIAIALLNGEGAGYEHGE